jgi:hypothetical protein
MRTHLLGAALFAVSLLFPLLCPAQSVALLGGRPLEIPFQLHSGYLVIVEGSIGPFGHLKFILDTGTTRTCIDRGLARQLALPLEAESVFRFDNQVRLNSTHLASLTLGPLQAENFIVNVADLSHVGISHAPIDAIIGLDVLESFPFQIDYEQMRVIFGPIPSLAESASMDAIPLLPVVSLDFNGFKSLWLIDTGAMKTVLFSEKQLLHFPFQRGRHPARDASVHSSLKVSCKIITGLRSSGSTGLINVTR